MVGHGLSSPWHSSHRRFLLVFRGKSYEFIEKLVLIRLYFVPGLYYTFSIYFLLLQEEFQSTSAMTAWVGSLYGSVFMLGGKGLQFLDLESG